MASSRAYDPATDAASSPSLALLSSGTSDFIFSTAAESHPFLALDLMGRLRVSAVVLCLPDEDEGIYDEGEVVTLEVS